MSTATVREVAEFSIIAHDANGKPRVTGGDSFFVAVRGGSHVRARVRDNEDGSYRVTYTPSVSGKYSIAIGLFGTPLPGSPFALTVYTQQPDAAQCILQGQALASIIARTSSQFEVCFRDTLGKVAMAEDLDVFVEPIFLAPPAFAQASATVASVPAAAEEASAEGTETGGGSGCGATKLFKKARVQVGAKPLVLRSGPDTDSELIGKLRPGQLLTVLDERRTDDGDVRAQVALVYEDESAEEYADSWWTANPVLRSFDPVTLGGDTTLFRCGAALLMNSFSAGAHSIYDGKAPVDSERGGYVVARKSKQGMLRAPPAHRLPIFGSREPQAVGWCTIVKEGAELVRRREKLDAGQRQQHLQMWARRAAVDRTLAATNEQAAAKKSKTSAVAAAAAAAAAAATPHGNTNVYVQELQSDPKEIGFAYGGIVPGVLHSKGKLHDVHKVTYSVGRAGRYLLHVRLRNQVLPLKGSPFALEVKPGAAHAQSTELPVCALPLRGIVGLGESFGCRFSMKTADKCANLCDRGGGKVECKCLDKNVTTSVVDNNDGTYTLSLRSKYSGTSEVHVTIDGMHVRGSPASMKLTSTQPDLERTVCLGEGLQHASAGKPTTFRVRFVDEHGNTATPGSGLKMGLALVPEAAPRSELVPKKGNSTHVAKKAAITAAELQTLTEHAFESKWVAEGELEIEFVGTTAGFNDLYVWAVDTPKPIKLAKASGGDKGATTKRQASSGAAEKRNQSTLIGGSSSSDIASAAVPLDPRMRMRILLPGAPFSLAISSGKGNIANSHVAGFVRESAAEKVNGISLGGKWLLRQTVEYQSDTSMVIAGDTVLIRPKILDQFGNPALLPEGALAVLHEMPDGTQDGQPMVVQPQTRGGLTTYDIRDTPSLAGTHKVQLLLFGKPLPGSPVTYRVLPDCHEPSMCLLNLPAEPPPAPPHFHTEEVYPVTLTMRDRFGNQCNRGGAVVNSRLVYVKQGVHDSTTLSSSNHSVRVEDNRDGTYSVLVSLLLGSFERALFPCVINVEVNLDRDPKERPTGINLPALPMTFVRNPATETPLQQLQRVGKQVATAAGAIKKMKSIAEAPAAAPAAEPAAAPAAASAGEAAPAAAPTKPGK